MSSVYLPALFFCKGNCVAKQAKTGHDRPLAVRYKCPCNLFCAHPPWCPFAMCRNIGVTPVPAFGVEASSERQYREHPVLYHQDPRTHQPSACRCHPHPRVSILKSYCHLSKSYYPVLSKPWILQPRLDLPPNPPLLKRQTPRTVNPPRLTSAPPNAAYCKIWLGVAFCRKDAPVGCSGRDNLNLDLRFRNLADHNRSTILLKLRQS